MELFLNLAGAFVAVAIICLWLRWRPRTGGDRRTQVVALALLILILFPVISVTDDLLAAQNPAETDTLVRRDLIACALHAASPLIAVLPEPPIAALPFGSLGFAAPGTLPLVAINSPALDPIENRPPPTA